MVTELALTSLVSNKREWSYCFLKFSLNAELFYLLNDRMLYQFLQNDRRNQLPRKVITIYELTTEIDWANQNARYTIAEKEI